MDGIVVTLEGQFLGMEEGYFNGKSTYNLRVLVGMESAKVFVTQKNLEEAEKLKTGIVRIAAKCCVYKDKPGGYFLYVVGENL